MTLTIDGAGPRDRGASPNPGSATARTPGSTVAAIGAPAQVSGFALAGARVYPADTAEQARAAWDTLTDAVAVVILTAAAADAIGAGRARSSGPLRVVMPE